MDRPHTYKAPFSPPLPSPCQARFLERPNRFTVQCEVSGKRVTAFLPNPGRLWEILLPEAELLVVPAPTTSGKAESSSRLPFVVVAARKEHRYVFLHTHLTNMLAEWLLNGGYVSGLKGWTVSQREVSIGSCRFDFLLRRNSATRLAEVKSVTLFHNGVAMFPDAVTDRGRRHLIELAQRSPSRRRNCVLFVVHAGDVDYMMPDYHTDFAFARTMYALRERLQFDVALLEWDEHLNARPVRRSVTIPWSYLRRELVDRGTLIAIAGTPATASTETPSTLLVATVDGRMTRYERSTSLRKLLSEVMDPEGDKQDHCRFVALPIRGSSPCTDELAMRLTRLYGEPVIRAARINAEVHSGTVYRAPGWPLWNRSFLRLLLDARMRRPEQSARP